MLAQWEGEQWEHCENSCGYNWKALGAWPWRTAAVFCPFASTKSAKSLDCPSHTHTHTHTTDTSVDTHTHTHHRNSHTHSAPTHAHQIWKGTKINPKKRKKQQNKKLNIQKKCRYETKKVKNVAQGERRRQCWKGERKGREGRGEGKGRSAVTVAEAEKICKRLHKNEIATKTQR